MNPLSQTLIICFATAAPMLLIAGAWAYQVFALKRELDAAERRLDKKIDDLEARLTQRMDRFEDELRRTNATLQTIARDMAADTRYLAGRIEKEKQP